MDALVVVGTTSSLPLVLSEQLSDIVGGPVAIYAVARDLHREFVRVAGPDSLPTSASIPTLAKWLRVNGSPVTQPDPDDVICDLPQSEQQWLHAVGARISVPILLDGELVGVACALERPDASAAPREAQLEKATQWARSAASAWQRAMENAQLQSEQAAAYRSQQLSTTGQLAASVAHEVRNPLAAVRSIVQLVRDTTPAPERRSVLLSDVLTEVDRIDHVVSGLLGLSKPHETTVCHASVADMTTEAIRFMEPLARRKSIELRCAIDASPAVQIDPREFRQVLLNVLLNACEACRHGDTIAVTVSQSSGSDDHDGTAEVSVRDTGAGITAAEVSRVFEPFFTTKPSGSGLGLGVCRDLMQKHGGEISLESANGTGTLVRLHLPLVAPA